jgi:hypothetical protein
MEATKKFEKYNAKRFGRPWIGKVTSWPEGGRAELEFGKYEGDENGGEATIDEVEEGGLVRWGQKSLKEGDKFNSFWGVVQSDGSIKEIPWQDAKDKFGNGGVIKKKINWDSVTDEELVEEALRRKFIIHPESDDSDSLPMDDLPEEDVNG